MALEAWVVAEGVPHHLTQRGNNRQDVFLQDADRRLYIETLRTKDRDHGLKVLGYYLMRRKLEKTGTRKLGQPRFLLADSATH